MENRSAGGVSVRAFRGILISVLVLLSLGFADACPAVISSPGSYTQTADYVGAPNPTAPLGDYACVLINVSDVEYDCGGYGIEYDNSASGTTYGIYISDPAYGTLSNITIRNCPSIANYTHGISTYYMVEDVTIENVNVHHSSSVGFYLQYAPHATMTNSTTHDNYYGFLVSSSNYGNIANSTAYNNYYGFYFESNSYSNIANITLRDNTYYGFYISSSYYNNFTNNTASNSYYGFYLSSADGNIFTDNTARDNSNYGFDLYYSQSNKLTRNIMANNSIHQIYVYGGLIVGGYTNTIYDNIFNATGTQGVVYSDSYTNWNASKTAGTNIIGGANVGGNFYSNYTGKDADEDGIGETTYPANSYITSISYQSNYSYEQGSTGTWINFANTYDHDWDTYGTMDNNSEAYYNFTIPAGFSSERADVLAKWNGTAGSGGVNTTMSIGSSTYYGVNCLISDPLRIKIVATDVWYPSTVYTEIYCWDYGSSNWAWFGTSTWSSAFGNDTAIDMYEIQVDFYNITKSPSIDYLPLTNKEVCVNLTDDSTWGTKVVNASGIFYVNANTTLCTDTYYLDTAADTPAIYMNASNIRLDCDGSVLNGVDDNGYGLLIENYSNDTIKNCIARNFASGFQVSISQHDQLVNNIAYGNPGSGFAIHNSSYINLSSNTAYGSGLGFSVNWSANNTFANTIAHDNSGYGILLASNVTTNIFTNTLIYNQSYYIKDPALFSPSNDFHNLTLGYSSSIGLLNYHFLNVTDLDLTSTNLILNQYFVSLNDSAAPQANASANITVSVESCSLYNIMKKEGFPTSRSEIILTGSPYTPSYETCAAKKLTFDVTGFSGYAGNSSTPCVNLSNESTWGTSIVNVSGVLYVDEDTVLCKDTYYLDAAGSTPALRMNASGITLDCAGSTINGVNGDGYGISSNTVDHQAIENCMVTNYQMGFYMFYLGNSTLINNSAFNNTGNGFTLAYGGDNTFTNNTAHENAISGMAGFFISYTNGNMFSNNTAYNNTNGGFFFNSFENSIFTGNTVHDQAGSYHAFYSEWGGANKNNTFISNSAYNSTIGFYMYYSTSNITFADNAAFNNSQGGFYFYTVENGNLTNNTVRDTLGSNGAFNCYMLNNVTFSGNGIYNNSYYGIYAAYVYNSTFTDNTIVNNSQYAFYLYNGGRDNNFANNSVHDGAGGGFYLSSMNNISFTGGSSYSNLYGFSISVSNSTFSDNAAYNNSNGGFSFSGGENNQVTNNSANLSLGTGFSLGNMNNISFTGGSSSYNNHGFYISVVSNSTIANNIGHNNSQNGFYTDSGQNNNFTNNSAYGNTAWNGGFFFGWGTNNNITFTENSAHDNAYGFFAYYVTNSTLSGNTAYDNTNGGFYLSSCPSNNLTGNTAYNNPTGFYIYSSGNTLTNNVAFNGSTNGFYISTSPNNFTNNSAYNNANGFYLDSATYNLFIDSSAFNNTNYGFTLSSANNNNLTGSTAYGNTNGCFFFNWANNNVLADTFAYDSSGFGIRLFSSTNNNFTNTFIYNHTQYLYQDWISPSDPNRFTNLTLGYNGTVGLVSYPSINTTNLILYSTDLVLDPYFVSLDDASAAEANLPAYITIMTANCSWGVLKKTGFPTSLVEILTYGERYFTDKTCSGGIATFNVSSFSGYALGQAATNLTITFMPSNPVEYGFETNASCNASNSEVPVSLYNNATGSMALVAGPAPGYVEYFENHSVGTYNYTCNATESENYSAAETSGILNVTKKNTYLDLTFLPSSSEPVGTLTNVSCNASNSEVELNLYRNAFFVTSGYSYVEEVTTLPGGLYLYECNASESENYSSANISGTLEIYTCTNISSPMVYTMAYDMTGSRNYGGIDACVYIDSSDVVLNCNGYDITGDGLVPWASGIYVGKTLTNVTIENCTVGNYSTGVYFSTVDSGRIANNEVFNNTNYGLYLASSSGNHIGNNLAHGSSTNIYLDQSNTNVLDNNTAYDATLGGPGFYLYCAASNNLTNNTAYNNGYGFYLDSSFCFGPGGGTNILADNSAYDNSDTGFWVAESGDNISGGNAYSNANVGVFLQSVSNTNVHGVSAYGNGDGIRLYASTYGNIYDNQMTGNTQYGLYVGTGFGGAAEYNNFTRNNIADNGLFQVAIVDSSFNTFYNNIINATGVQGVIDSNTFDYWNTTKTLSTNIIGGPNIGGNFYSNYSGYDNDSDGIGQFVYYINSASFPVYTNVYPYSEAYTGTWDNFGNTHDEDWNTYGNGTWEDGGEAYYNFTVPAGTYTTATVETKAGGPGGSGVGTNDYTINDGSTFTDNCLNSGAGPVQLRMSYTKGKLVTFMRLECWDYNFGGSWYSLGTIGTSSGPSVDLYESKVMFTDYTSIDVIDYLPLTNNRTYPCVNLSNPDSFKENVVNDSGLLYVNRNTTICNGTYYLDSAPNTPVFRMNASNIYLICEGTILDGIDDNGWGIQIGNKENDSIENCTFRNYQYGFVVVNSRYNRLANNTAHGNPGAGFVLYAGSDNTLTDNTVFDNLVGFWIQQTSGNNLTGITAHDNSNYAIYTNLSSSIDMRDITLSNQSYWIGSNGSTGISLSNLITSMGSTQARFGSVSYSTDVGLEDANFLMKTGMASLNSSERPEFNTSARITMWAPNCAYPTIMKLEGFPSERDDILQNGTICTECTLVSCTGNTIVFDAPHFTGYSAGGEESLTIDNNGPKYSNETITFNASYINTTDGSHIAGADCNLTLWNWSSYLMGEDVDHYELDLNVSDPGPHSYNVTCSKAGSRTLTAFDTFTIFLNGTPYPVNLYAANVTMINTSSYNDTGPVASTGTEEGNRTWMDLSGNSSTRRWTGFYGNVSGTLVLAQSEETKMLYIWLWNPSLGGVACASTGSSPPSELVAATYADIDTAWGFPPSSTDSAENTFNNMNCSQNFGYGVLNNSYYATTGYSGDFITCAWKTAFAPSKSQMVFCTNISSGSTLYNGLTGDYEMMVPAAYGPDVYEEYYFYLNLD